MKATLDFNLPEESAEFLHAVRGVRYYSALLDLDNKIRNYLKHNENNTPIDHFLSNLRADISAAAPEDDVV